MSKPFTEIDRQVARGVVQQQRKVIIELRQVLTDARADVKHQSYIGRIDIALRNAVAVLHMGDGA